MFVPTVLNPGRAADAVPPPALVRQVHARHFRLPHARVVVGQQALKNCRGYITVLQYYRRTAGLLNGNVQGAEVKNKCFRKASNLEAVAQFLVVALAVLWKQT